MKIGKVEKFGDLLTNALHAIKSHTGKKIGILQDEIGYAFKPIVTGDAVENWRYRKAPPSLDHLEQLSRILIGYAAPTHNRVWLHNFLISGGHPYPDAISDQLFPEQKERESARAQEVPAPPPLLASPPPLSAYAPPQNGQFVGRSDELNHYANQLERQNRAIIIGMAGVGKTTLAADLAQRLERPENIFWHRFFDGGLTPFLRRIAGFLANHRQTELWEMFEVARQNGTKPPELETQLDTLSAHLTRLADETGKRFLLCLDDLQFVDDDPRFGDFLARLLTHLPDHIRLIITSRRWPPLLRQAAVAPLSGISPADMETLLQKRALSLSDELRATLHSATGGNGTFLTLAIVALQQSQEPATLIKRLAAIDDIERFLLEEVNDRLTANEQRAMEGIAILSGYPGTRGVIEALLNQRDIRKTLRGLADQFLLQTEEGENGRAYRQHQIVQGFYYEQPRRATRRELHRRAALFYEEEEIDYFQATFHAIRAEEGERGAELANTHLWAMINAGHGRALADVLDEVKEEPLTETTRFNLWLTKASLDTLLGDIENGREQLEKAAERLQHLPINPESDRLKAQVCLQMAELFERESPPDGLTWAQRGLDIVPRSQIELKSRLKSISGTLHMHMGNFGAALETLHDSLETIPEQASVLQADTLHTLGAVYWNMGQLGEAQRYTEEALSISQTNRHHDLTARTLINAGPLRYIQGDWAGGIDLMEQGLVLAEKLGNHNTITGLVINLASCYVTAGYDEEAKTYLDRAELLTQINQPHMRMTVLILKAELASYANEVEEIDLGIAYLDEAEALVETTNDQKSLPMVYALRAQFNRALHQNEAAVTWARQSVQQSTVLGDLFARGMAERVLGEALTDAHKWEEAQAALERSISFLKDESEYDTALSEIRLAALLRQMGKREQALAYLDQAYAVCAPLGAKRAIKEVETEKSRLAAPI